MANKALLSLVVIVFATAIFGRENQTFNNNTQVIEGLTLTERMGKLFNISVDPSLNQRGVRQYPPIAKFCTDKDLGGSCVFMYSYDLDWPTSTEMGVLFNAMSSMQVMNTDYVFDIWTGTNYAGTHWIFRYYNVVNLSDYPGLNDNIESITAAYAGTAVTSVTLFENANLKGKSIYVVAGSYASITSAAFNGGGSFGNDALSSCALFPSTNVIFYRDTNLTPSSPTMSYSASTAVVVVNQVSNNDWASSLEVHS